MNLKKTLFLSILFLSQLHFFCFASLYSSRFRPTAYHSNRAQPFGADDVLEMFEEMKSNDPTSENLERALRKGQIDKAFQLFEKGVPATGELFKAYLNEEKLTATRKENVKKIFERFTEESQKRIAHSTLKEAINNKEPATALFALELGAPVKEYEISIFLHTVDMSRKSESFAERINNNTRLFEKLLESINVIPHSDFFSVAANIEPKFAEMLLQKGTKPNKGDLFRTVLKNYLYYPSDKEELVKLVLPTGVELTDDEIIYLMVNMPEVAKLRDLKPTESMQSKIDAQIKEKEEKEEKEKQEREDHKKMRENLIKELPVNMRQNARSWTIQDIKQKIDERKSRNTLFISTAVIGTLLLTGYGFYKYKQFKKQQEEQEKRKAKTGFLYQKQ